MVQNLLQWIKDNAVTVLCAAVIVLSLGMFGWVYASGSSFKSEMAARESEVQTIDQYKIRQVKIPPEDPDDPPTQINMPVTEPAIAELKKVYTALDNAFRTVYRDAGERNRAGHAPMLAGLFPKPADPAKRFTAREAYIASIYALYAALDAGAPPKAEEITEAMNLVEKNLRQSYLLAPGAQLTAAQQKELTKQKVEKLEQLCKRASGKFHLYAAPLNLGFEGKWEPGPFQVGDWAKSSRPEIADIWEAQMQLWIQQDLVQAIRIANDVTNTETSLLQQPVKRLISIKVDPEYIGIGDISKISPENIDPTTLLTAEAYETAVGSKLPNNFAASPTGRQSNVLYDVRHAYLTVIVDSRQLPKLLNAIGQVNFMTIIGMNMTSVDEFADLPFQQDGSGGYWYGTGVDAMLVEFKIETIWLRSWTAGHVNAAYAASLTPPEQFNPGLMPDTIRVRLGLPARDQQDVAPDAPPADGAPGAPGAAPAPGTPEAAPATPEAPAAPPAPAPAPGVTPPAGS